MITDINSEDRLIQKTFHLEKALGWESVYAYNAETFGPQGTLGRASERDVVLTGARIWSASSMACRWSLSSRPPFTENETDEIAERVYDYVWQRSASGLDFLAA